MTYLEWLKEYDKSHITHPTRQDVWDGAWNYQQAKIDAVIKALEDNFQYLEGNEPALILMDDIKEILK